MRSTARRRGADKKHNGSAFHFWREGRTMAGDARCLISVLGANQPHRRHQQIIRKGGIQHNHLPQTWRFHQRTYDRDNDITRPRINGDATSKSRTFRLYQRNDGYNAYRPVASEQEPINVLWPMSGLAGSKCGDILIENVSMVLFATPTIESFKSRTPDEIGCLHDCLASTQHTRVRRCVKCGAEMKLRLTFALAHRSRVEPFCLIHGRESFRPRRDIYVLICLLAHYRQARFRPLYQAASNS